MKIYTFYTDTHESMFHDYFFPSVPETYELFVKYFPQECKTGTFHSDGWMKTMSKKVDYVIESIELEKQSKNTWFIHSDCDVQFFDKENQLFSIIDGLMKDNDIVCMDDGMCCAGFFACKVNDKMKNLWLDVKNNLTKFPNDQIAMNYFLQNGNYKYSKFPRFEFFNYMHTIGKDDIWTPEKDIYLTNEQLNSMLVHHANYIIGVDNKIKMMEMIRNAKSSKTKS